MSFPRYAHYQESGVEWIGDVPSHWRLDRLKRSLVSCRNGVWGEETNGDDNDILCVRVADFDRTRLRVQFQNPTFRNVAGNEREHRQLGRGNLLLEKSGGGEGQPVGAVVLFDYDLPAVCSNFIARIVLAPNMHPAFWCYFHRAAYDCRLTIRSINQTSGIQNLDHHRYFEEVAAYPPFEEQIAIASFLDRETAEINALLEDQQRLIELLKEKRQAVISHSVTKGLDPNAQLKDTGFEWLGTVPAHWNVLRLKSICSSIFLGLTTKVDYVEEGGVPLVRALNIAGGVLDLSDARCISEKQHQSLTKRNRATRGDVLLSKSGSIGTAAIVEADIEFSIYESIFALRSRDELIIPGYLLQLLRSQACLAQYSASSVGMGVGHLNMSDIVEVRVALPPIAEQARILAFIESETAKLNALIAEAHHGILLLQERRGALISAAVTGKIDVRGLVEADVPIPDVVAA